MKAEFELLKITRQNILKATESLSEEQLIKIPTGFNNNILWHMGHIVSSTQKLTYGLSELPLRVSDSFPVPFGKGSSPKEWTSTPDIKEVKHLLTHTLEKIIEDYNQGLFKSYKEYPTSYGFVLKNIDAAILFCNVHESLHYGNILSMRKLV